MRKCEKDSVEARVFKWYRIAAGCIAAVLLIVGILTFTEGSESVMQEEPVDASDIYSFSFATQEGGTDSDEVYYSDLVFSRGNALYDHDLARTSLALSMSAFRKSHVTGFLGELGYERVIAYRYGSQADEDKVALAIGHKTLNRKERIVAVALRGGKYGDEWGSNGRIGYNGESYGYHYGFHKAAEDAVVQLKEYAAENELDLGSSYVWITGFSRGAAVANVMGAMLTDSGSVSPEKMFDYTFASPSTVSETLAAGTAYRGIYNIVNPPDIVTHLPMNVSGISKTSGGKTVRYNWDYIKYGTTLNLPAGRETAQLQVVQLMENALAFATRNEERYVSRLQDQVIVPALKKTMGKGADVSKRNVGFVLVDSLPGVAGFLKDEVNKLDFKAQLYVAGILSGKKSIRLEKEHWPETYWGWMVKADGLE